jgi:peptidyl-prolyl cis-trans isomerase A (cyclophilin A)
MPHEAVPQWFEEEVMNAKDAQAPETYRVRFETTKGNFTVEVTRAWAPLGADRFYNVVKSGLYDGARFFRVLPGFVVQFGIPGDPALARQWRSANIADDPVTQTNAPGTITFATSGPNSRTTQVFINFGKNGNLDPMGFAPFGRVSEGMDIVGQLYSGYGEGGPRGRGPDQGRIQTEGNAYLERDFPKMDYIKKAAIEES